MSKHRAKDGRRDIEIPRPDDPILAAFGIEPEEAQTARMRRRPQRRMLRAAMITGLAIIAVVAGSLFLRPQHMAAHAETPAAPATTAPAAARNPFNDAMTAAMMSMHMAMDLPYSGDPDRDFARMMIPHHQGAIDMAKLELQYGKDPRLRRLAEEIIVTQQQEIAVMQLVLKDLAADSSASGTPSSSAAAPAGGTPMEGMQMNGMPNAGAVPGAVPGTAPAAASAP
jgi:hypothetical protein